MTTTPKSYDYGRFYARSEKHLTDVLNERAGKGNWIKTKVMIDAYGNSHKAIDGRDPVPTFPDDEDDNGGWGYSKQVYRGVVFKDATAALNVKMFVNAVDDQKPEDRVLARTFNTVEIGNRARIYGLPASGLPWETKAEADAALAQARAAQDAFHKSLREDFEGLPTLAGRAQRRPSQHGSRRQTRDHDHQPRLSDHMRRPHSGRTSQALRPRSNHAGSEGDVDSQVEPLRPEIRLRPRGRSLSFPCGLE